MSILLTASKHAMKNAAAKNKKKRQQRAQQAHRREAMMAQAEANAAAHVPYDDTPPPSSKFIKVWHWMLCGTQTTILFTKATNEVWCNGFTLEVTTSSLEQEVLDAFDCRGNDDGFLATDTTRKLDFVIHHPEREREFTACIYRLPKYSEEGWPISDENGVLEEDPVLYVNNTYIHEHKGEEGEANGATNQLDDKEEQWLLDRATQEWVPNPNYRGNQAQAQEQDGQWGQAMSPQQWKEYYSTCHSSVALNTEEYDYDTPPSYDEATQGKKYQ